MSKHSLIKSPFLLATLSGMIAIGTDLWWLIVDTIIRHPLLMENLMLYGPVYVGLTLALVLGCIAIYRYLRNGYIQQEHLHEVHHHVFMKVTAKKAKKHG